MPLAGDHSKEIIMNKDTLEGQWNQLKGKAKAKWGDITDDEWTEMKGNSQRLAGLIQERYGRSREEAEKEVNDFWETNRSRDL